MYKKIILKITLLLSNASMFATSARRALGLATRGVTCALRTFSTIQKARYITLREAIRNQEVEVAKALLEQGQYNLSNASFPDTGHSLAFTAILTDNATLVELLCNHGARLFEEEQNKCDQEWQDGYPSLFRSSTFAADFAPYEFGSSI